MATYRLDIEYDGTDWFGWQSQPEGHTIQDAIENALETALRIPISITGSGRTDSGVHARGQVAHFKCDKDVDVRRLLGALNGILPASIAIRRIQEVADSFHARYDARQRIYKYRICTVPIAVGRSFVSFVAPQPDIELMNRAANHLCGEHDFSAFCRTASETKNRICSVMSAEWTPGLRDDIWVFTIHANRFLHGMVRSIVGTLIEIGHGKRPGNSLTDLIESRDRAQAGFAAPAKGLTLEQVIYDAD